MANILMGQSLEPEPGAYLIAVLYSSENIPFSNLVLGVLKMFNNQKSE